MNWLADLPRRPRTTLRRVVAMLAGHAESSPVGELRLAIVIPLEGGARQQAIGVQTAIYRRFGYNPALEATPHITLKLGFRLADTARMEAYLADLAAEIPPIPVTMEQYGFFENENILFFDVAPNARLDELRLRIIGDLRQRFQIEPHPIEGDDFRFHVTLASGLGRREFAQLRESHAGQEVNLTFMARQIELLGHLGGHWIPLRSLLLGKPPEF